MHLVGNARKLTSLAATLVRAKLWEPHASGDGWQIADYLRDNRSRAQHEAGRAELSRQRSAAGRTGAGVRWGRSTTPAKPPAPQAQQTLDAPWKDEEFTNGGINEGLPEKRAFDGKADGKPNGKLP